MPVSPDRLVELLVGLIAASGAIGAAPRLRVAVDGPPAAAPASLADALVEPLRSRGRPVARVSADSFLRPASLRLEHGRTDADSYRSGWLDVSALQREVLGPFGSRGRFLPSLWDAARDRATRLAPRESPPGAVLIVDGTFLLDRRLAFDVTVHLHLNPDALARRTPADLRWTLPAFDGYDGAGADVVVALSDPAHPAVTVRAGDRSAGSRPYRRAD